MAHFQKFKEIIKDTIPITYFIFQKYFKNGVHVSITQFRWNQCLLCGGFKKIGSMKVDKILYRNFYSLMQNKIHIFNNILITHSMNSNF